MSTSPVPVIDISRFDSGAGARAAIARQVDNACRQYGFLVIRGHGIDARLIDRIDTTSRAFFDLPRVKKERYHLTDSESWRGYFAVQSSSLAKTLGIEEALPDLREYFTITNPDVDRTDPYYQTPEASVIFAPNLYPTDIAGLQDAWEDYYRAMADLAEKLMRIFAVALDLDERWFADKIDRHMTNLVVSNYPDPCGDESPDQMRAGPHTDYGTLTILRAEDKPGGLEILTKEGDWSRVPILPDTFVINIGDLMARWTNDQWVSTLHRVTAPPPGQRVGSRRLSLTFFHQPNWDAVVDCIPSCLGEDRRYPSITSGEHLEAQRQMQHAVEGAKK
ncbi:2OG-Fe(II) oxygenase [Sphingobium sp. Ant17]|nr:2OG-Fe(II) oxygenase [Sphingobium sp. Ant17]